MEFIYTSVFEKRWKELGFNDDDSRDFEIFLCEKPDRGDVIQGTNGLRKVRWKISEKGKSGGVRIIYLLIVREFIYLITVYGKKEKDDLTPDEKKIFKQLVKRIKDKEE